MDLLQDAVKFRNVLQIIDVPATTGGKYAKVLADPQRQKAICCIE